MSRRMPTQPDLFERFRPKIELSPLQRRNALQLLQLLLNEAMSAVVVESGACKEREAGDDQDHA